MDSATSQTRELDLHALLGRKQTTILDPTCPVCHRPEAAEIRQAIETGVVVVCTDCHRPMLRAEYDFSMQSYEENSCCYCYCICPDPVWNSDDLPEDLLPFAPNNRSATPKPWVLDWLSSHGFRSPNRQSAVIRQQLASNQYLPTRRSIIDGSYQIGLSELAALPLIDFESARHQHFPNQVERSATESGLPVPLEAIIRHLDPDAFGHRTRQWYERDVFRNFETIEFASESEVYTYCRLQQLLSGGERSARDDPVRQFHVWAIENEKDEDRESVCTADELGVHRCEYEQRLPGFDEFWNH